MNQDNARAAVQAQRRNAFFDAFGVRDAVNWHGWVGRGRGRPTAPRVRHRNPKHAARRARQKRAGR